MKLDPAKFNLLHDAAKCIEVDGEEGLFKAEESLKKAGATVKDAALTLLILKWRVRFGSCTLPPRHPSLDERVIREARQRGYL